MIPDRIRERLRMVETQLEARGISDPAVLQAFRTVPREVFVPPRIAHLAYEDMALPIDAGQTISQPYIVALMASALELRHSDRVLEVGTGSGYGAAILSRLAAQVYTVERHAQLVEEAARRLDLLEYSNVEVLHANGTLGWPEHAPFDAIVVTAGGPAVPEALLSQLASGGRLVMPVGSLPRSQVLTRVRRTGEGRLERENLCGVRFVPLIGAEGWPVEGVEEIVDSFPEEA